MSDEDCTPENIIKSIEFHDRPGALAIFGMAKRLIERLTREVADASEGFEVLKNTYADFLKSAGCNHINELVAKATRAEAAERKVERLRNLVQTLIDNDPDEPISDAGHTVIDLWRHEARDALAETEKGDE